MIIVDKQLIAFALHIIAAAVIKHKRRYHVGGFITDKIQAVRVGRPSVLAIAGMKSEW